MLKRLYTAQRPDDERFTPPVFLRRFAAVIALTAYPVIQLLVASDLEIFADLGTVEYVLLAGAVVLLWASSVPVIFEFRRRLAQAPDDELDERERTVRDEAYLISYRILAWILLLLAFAVLAVVPMFLGSREISLDVVLHAFFALVIVSWVLPSAVVAWRDTESGDLDEEEDHIGVPDGDVAGVDR